MRVAVIGSGVTGLTCAYLLNRVHDVALFERDSRPGGHAYTTRAFGTNIPVDIGFQVFNPETYPNMIQLFRLLGVEIVDTDMSFSLSEDGGRGYEWGSDNLSTVFAQRGNALDWKFLRMLYDVWRFPRAAQQLLADESKRAAEMSLVEFLQANRFSDGFRDLYLLPMCSAVWSASMETLGKFPARSLMRFFSNHKLDRGLAGRPTWMTPAKRSEDYVDRVCASLRNPIQLNAHISAITERDGKHYLVVNGKEQGPFDHVVFACHPDQALELLGDTAAKEERDVLSLFKYQRNDVVLHKDPALMPTRRSCWTSWNYLSSGGDNALQRDVCVTYYVNRLQHVDTEEDLFVTLNPIQDPAPSAFVEKVVMYHPVFDQSTARGQDRLASIQGIHHRWYCGAYTGYGFHEDGLVSGMYVAKALGADIPWKPDWSRLLTHSL